MALGNVRVGDLKTDVQVLCQDTDVNGVNQTINLALTTVQQIEIIDPTGLSRGVFTASILNPPGSDGLIHYVTSGVTSIWDMTGSWHIHGILTYSDGSKSTTSDGLLEVT